MVFLQARFSCPIVAAIALSFVLGGGIDDSASKGNGDRDSDTEDLSGEVYVNGSSVLFPISEPMAEEFMKKNPEVRVTIGISSSGSGFKKFCWGETDINNSSRPIKESEIKLCKEAGIEFVEIPIAFEGIVVAVNNDNNWVNCMTLEELGKMWKPAAEGKIDNWNQIRDYFPDEALSLYGHSWDSSHYDFFTHVTYGEEGESRQDYTASYDDDFLARGIQADRGGLGFFGFPYYKEHKNLVKVVAIENDAGECVLPSLESIQDGSYNPLSRPLFIYVKRESIENNSAVKAFVEYQIDTANAWLIEKLCYVPVPSELLSKISEWLSQIEPRETRGIDQSDRF